MSRRPRCVIRRGVTVLALVAVAQAATPGQVVPPDAPRTLSRWWTVPGEAVGSPAADDTTAYFLSKSHEVLAIDAASGKVRWRRPTNESGYGGTGATVVVSGSVVVVGDDNLLAFERRTGSLRWRFEPSEGYGPGFYLSYAATADGVVYAGSPSGRVYAVEAETGRLRWSTVVANDGKTTVFPPRFSGAFVAAGYTEFVAPNLGGVVLLAADTGRILWKRPFLLPRDRSLSVNWAGGPVFANDLVVVSSGDGHVHAYDVASGDERWFIPPVSVQPGNLIDPTRDFRGLAVSGRILVSGSLTGEIVGYDLESRDERSRYSAGRLGSVIFRIEAIDDVVYVPFAGGTLLALRASDGAEMWRVGDWRASILWPPVLWQELVVVSGAVDGFSAFHAIK
jgi:glucose dehydrogenase